MYDEQNVDTLMGNEDLLGLRLTHVYHLADHIFSKGVGQILTWLHDTFIHRVSVSLARRDW
jgi:hypothetical protein